MINPQFWRVYVDTLIPPISGEIGDGLFLVLPYWTYLGDEKDIWVKGWFVLGVTLLDLFRRRKRHMGEMCLKVLHWVSYLFQPTKTRYVFQQHELME